MWNEEDSFVACFPIFQSFKLILIENGRKISHFHVYKLCSEDIYQKAYFVPKFPCF